MPTSYSGFTATAEQQKDLVKAWFAVFAAILTVTAIAKIYTFSEFLHSLEIAAL